MCRLRGEIPEEAREALKQKSSQASRKRSTGNSQGKGWRSTSLAD